MSLVDRSRLLNVDDAACVNRFAYRVVNQAQNRVANQAENRVENQGAYQVLVDIVGDNRNTVDAQLQIDHLNQLCSCQRSRAVCLED